MKPLSNSITTDAVFFANRFPRHIGYILYQVFSARPFYFSIRQQPTRLRTKSSAQQLAFPHSDLFQTLLTNKFTQVRGSILIFHNFLQYGWQGEI